MMNKAVLIGRLTRDPELRYLPSGVSVATFTLAVDRSFTNQQGQREADFIPIVVWRGLAETCSKYLSKGRLVAVSGRIQTRSYDTPDGQRRYVTEIVGDEVQFLERADHAANREFGGPERNYQPQSDINTSHEPFHPIDDEDDELPF